MISQGIKLEQLFNDFLSMKTGRGNGSGNTHSFGEIFGKQLQDSKQNTALLQSSFLAGLKGTSGQDPLENIKKFLQALGLKLEDVSAGKDALAGLQKLLLKSGFEQEEIQTIFDSFQMTGKKIKLSDLFARLATMRKNEEEDGSKALMPSSAVPFFQAILPVLGLDDQTAESALSYAKTQGGNINMERLISFLKGLGSMSSEPGAAKQLPENVSQMMKSLGIPVASHQENQLSLPQFVSRLEMMLYENSGKVVSGNHHKKDLLEFLNSLHVNHVFSDNNGLTERLTRLKSTNPLEASKTGTNSKYSIFSDNRTTTPIAQDFNRSGQNQYYAMNRETHFTGKDFQSLLGDVPDKNNGTLFKSSMRELLEQTTQKQNARQNADFRMENGQLIDLKKDAHPVLGGKTVAEKPLPSYVMNQVSRQIVRSFQDGLHEIRLQLKPPHLGRLQIHLKTINDGLKVSIIAENNTTQKMLKTHSADLKAALLEHGIRLEKIDVEISFNFDQSMSQAKQDSRKSPNNKERVFRMENISESVDLQTIAHQGTLHWNTSGTLDLLA